MICLDVNVLVTAYRADLPDHDEYKLLLDRLANGSEPLGLPDIVLSGMLRLTTNRRIFAIPTPPTEAWADISSLLAAPACVLLTPGPTHWTAFGKLRQQIGARGNDIPDAYIAAYVVENNATLLSADRGFARFAQLKWRHPLD